jgi:hypothetical protein
MKTISPSGTNCILVELADCGLSGLGMEIWISCHSDVFSADISFRLDFPRSEKMQRFSIADALR